MNCIRNLNEDVIWVGGEDRRLALFENLFPIENGVSYNSYVILDEKTALIDTVDSAISMQFMENLLFALKGRELDYLIINHMEPDHCANIGTLFHYFPQLKIVGNMQIFKMIGQFFEIDLTNRMVEVKEGDELELGKHKLKFYSAPMVHWPEVMVTYDVTDKILFSADAFGTFGGLNGNIFADQLNFDRDYLDEARRYYSNIVGKFGMQVQAALKKLSSLEIEMIGPLHGPIWRENFEYILQKYDAWSKYVPEEEGIVIIYGSMYGYTENAANILANELSVSGVINIRVYDVSRTHVSVLISEIFRASHIVLAAPTYNVGIYPMMANLLHDMKALNVQNRVVGILDNGTWSPTSGKQVITLLSEMKNMTILEPMVAIKSALKGDSLTQLMELKSALLDTINK